MMAILERKAFCIKTPLRLRSLVQNTAHSQPTSVKAKNAAMATRAKFHGISRKSPRLYTLQKSIMLRQKRKLKLLAVLRNFASNTPFWRSQ